MDFSRQREEDERSDAHDEETPAHPATQDHMREAVDAREVEDHRPEIVDHRAHGGEVPGLHDIALGKPGGHAVHFFPIGIRRGVAFRSWRQRSRSH